MKTAPDLVISLSTFPDVFASWGFDSPRRAT